VSNAVVAIDSAKAWQDYVGKISAADARSCPNVAVAASLARTTLKKTRAAVRHRARALPSIRQPSMEIEDGRRRETYRAP